MSESDAKPATDAQPSAEQQKSAKALRSWTDLEARNRALPKDLDDENSKESKEKFDLIIKDLHSWIDGTMMWKIVKQRPLNIYWGTATTGRPHLGYFVPMYKIADFLKAGCNVKILFADLHGFLDNMKSNWELLEHRCNYYTFIIKQMLKLIGVDVESKDAGVNGLGKLEFVRGSSYQLERAFTLDVYKFSVQVTTNDTTRAGAEVVKQQASPLMSNLLYPIMQALDEEHLGCDVQFGGVDQRKIFMFSRENSHKLGYKKRGYLMNPLIPGLGKSGKMSSSEPLSKVDFDDSKESLAKKVRLAFCESPVEVEDGESAMNNGLLAICKFILFRFLENQNGSNGLVINDVHYKTYDALAAAFRDGTVHPSNLKPVFTTALDSMMAPMRQAVSEGEGARLLALAYPDVAKANERERKAREAARNAANKTVTLAAANIVVGAVGAVEELKDGDGLMKAMVSVDASGKKRMPCISKHLKENSLICVLLNNGPHFPAKRKPSVANILVAKNGDDEVPLVPPEGAKSGDAVCCEGVAPAPVKALKKDWAPILAMLKTSSDGVPCWDGKTLTCNGTALPAVSLKEAVVTNDAK